MCAFKCVIVEQRYMRQSAWVSGICIKCVIVGKGIKRLGYVLEPAMQRLADQVAFYCPISPLNLE